MNNEKSFNNRLTYLRKLITQESKKLNFWSGDVFRVNGYLYVIMYKYIPGTLADKDTDEYGTVFVTEKLHHRFFKREKIVHEADIEELIEDALKILNNEEYYNKNFKNL